MCVDVYGDSGVAGREEGRGSSPDMRQEKVMRGMKWQDFLNTSGGSSEMMVVCYDFERTHNRKAPYPVPINWIILNTTTNWYKYSVRYHKVRIRWFPSRWRFNHASLRLFKRPARPVAPIPASYCPLSDVMDAPCPPEPEGWAAI